jgi:hypothetical protein
MLYNAEYTIRYRRRYCCIFGAIIKAKDFKQAHAIAIDVADDNLITFKGTLIINITKLQEPDNGLCGYVYPTAVNKTYTMSDDQLKTLTVTLIEKELL